MEKSGGCGGGGFGVGGCDCVVVWCGDVCIVGSRWWCGDLLAMTLLLVVL